jgi:F-type H+-transporting ATPase subunit b
MLEWLLQVLLLALLGAAIPFALRLERSLREVRRDRSAMEGSAQGLSEAARMAEELSREAEATARRRRQMAEERIAAAEKTALHEVHNIAAEVATAAAAQMLREGYGAEQDAQLLDHAIAHIPAALSQKIQAL